VLELSERRACQVAGQARSTQRYECKVRDGEAALIGRMHELARENPRYGYRRIWKLLRREAWKVSRKRVHRLWRQEGFKVPQKARKKRRLGNSENSCARLSAEHPNHVWAWDFVHDRTEDTRPLKWLTMVDEFTRECLKLKVDRHLTSQEVIDALEELSLARGLPEHIRSDNGPEFVAKALKAWLEKAQVKTLYIEPGSPWENGYGETFNGKFRDEFLNCELFTSLKEAEVLGNDWKDHYNFDRPHSALGYETPGDFAKTWAGHFPGGNPQGNVQPETGDPTLIRSGT